MRPVLGHVKANAVAYVALFVALGGTSYAAIDLPAGSVGARQIKNHVIQPVKLDPNHIGGNVRVWASVNASGKVVAGGRGVTVTPNNAAQGAYIIDPRSGSTIARPRRCAAISSVDMTSGVAGYAEAEVATFSSGVPWQVNVSTFGATGVRTPLPFDVVVTC
jgi:hypothetical protein